MTFKNFLTILILLAALPVYAKESVDKLTYVNLDWWKNYKDEILIQHLQTLYNNNHDLKIAALKTKQSEENVRLIGANQLPQVGFDGSLSRVLSGAQTEFGNVIIPEYSQNEFVLPLGASYEIDIWGQNYLNRKSAKKQKEITEQQERATYIYITSSTTGRIFNKFYFIRSIQNNFILTYKITNSLF